MDANDRSPWLFSSSGALYPSIYLFRNKSTSYDRSLFVKARVQEAVRVRENNGLDIPILPYAWFRYVHFVLNHTLYMYILAI